MTRAAHQPLTCRSEEPASPPPLATRQAAVTCLVWTGPNDSLPEKIRQSLERRQVTLAWADSPTAVMLQLAQTPASLLMMVNPTAMADLPQVVAAIRRYYPQVVLWQCSHQGQTPLSLSKFPPLPPLPPLTPYPLSSPISSRLSNPSPPLALSTDSASFTQTESSLSLAPADPGEIHFASPNQKKQPIRPSRRIPYAGTKARSATRKAPPPAHPQLDAGPLLTREELEMLLNDDSAMRADRSPLSDDGL